MVVTARDQRPVVAVPQEPTGRVAAAVDPGAAIARDLDGDHPGPGRAPGPAWNTPAAERLNLLKRVRRNIDRHFDELVGTDVRAKGFVPGTATLAHREGTSVQTVIVPVAANASAAIEAYGSLLRKDPLKPLGVTSPGNGRFDIRVSPRG